MSQRWGIWFAVTGDLRFLSHHDMMRATERAAVRARLPLAYSQGFNPRPIVSLVCPRPVGVASREDLLVVCLAEPMPARLLRQRLNRQAPTGMEFVRAGTLPAKATPAPRRANYRLPLPPDRVRAVRSRLADLARRQEWCIERAVFRRRRKRAQSTTRIVDLRPLVADIACDAAGLRWALVPRGDLWARPGEVLALVGLDPRVDLADVVRTGVEYEPAPAAEAPAAPGQPAP